VQTLKREIRGHPGAALVLKKSSDTRELFAAMEKFCGFERENTVSTCGLESASTADGTEVRRQLSAVDRDAPIIPA
jgi:hypothetical protein